MFGKKLPVPQEKTVIIGQEIYISGWSVVYMGKINSSTCVFNCVGFHGQHLYVPIDGVFYVDETKVKIMRTDNESVTLFWEK